MINDRNPRWATLLLVLLAIATSPYFVRLGASSLWDSNEAFYAETPREMAESSDFISPRFNYQPRFNKPPLSYWIVAGFYELFGVSVTIERLAIVLGGLGIVAIAYALTRIAFCHEAALVAAAMLASSPRLLMFARRIMIDVYVSLFMGLALLFFALASSTPNRRRTYLSLMYCSIGLGVLTKGPIALLLPTVAIGVFLIFARKPGEIRKLMLPAGVLIIAAIVLPWYAAVYAQHGWRYIEAFLLEDNLSRYAERAWGPTRSFLFYIPVLAVDLFPSSIFLAPGVWLAFKLQRAPATGSEQTEEKEQEQNAEQTLRNRLPLLYAVWLAVIVVFFSLSKSKEDLYILPVYPAAAALSGIISWQLLSRQLTGRMYTATRWLLGCGGLLFAIAGAAGAYLLSYRESSYALAGAGLFGSAAFVGGVLTILSAKQRLSTLAIVALVVFVSIINWGFVLITLPDFERYKPVAQLCKTIQDRASDDALIGYYRLASPSMVFYLRRPVFEFYEPKELQQALCSGKEVFCIIPRSDYEALRPLLPVETHVLASSPVFQVKLKRILDKVSPPQVLLISNTVEQTTEQ